MKKINPYHAIKFKSTKPTSFISTPLHIKLLAPIHYAKLANTSYF